MNQANNLKLYGNSSCGIQFYSQAKSEQFDVLIQIAMVKMFSLSSSLKRYFIQIIKFMNYNISHQSFSLTFYQFKNMILYFEYA